jgi:hypothetical protein
VKPWADAGLADDEVLRLAAADGRIVSFQRVLLSARRTSCL